MEAKEQAAGERRVRNELIEPLMRRGLIRPAGITRDRFDDMLDDLARRLAYMSAASLAALEEQMAANPGGKGRDRFPIANAILDAARAIQPPPDDASPLIRAVFAHPVGQEAIAEGWAPELLADLRKMRRWPGRFVQSQLRETARVPVSRMADLEARAGGGEAIDPEDAAWWGRRTAILDRCREIAAMGDAP